ASSVSTAAKVWRSLLMKITTSELSCSACSRSLGYWTLQSPSGWVYVASLLAGAAPAVAGMAAVIHARAIVRIKYRYSFIGLSFHACRQPVRLAHLFTLP